MGSLTTPKFVDMHCQDTALTRTPHLSSSKSIRAYNCAVHKHKRPLLLIDWNTVVWLAPNHRARAVYEHQLIFSAHTQNEQLDRQLVDCEELFAEFDKKGYWFSIDDFTFNESCSRNHCRLVALGFELALFYSVAQSFKH